MNFSKHFIAYQSIIAGASAAIIDLPGFFQINFSFALRYECHGLLIVIFNNKFKAYKILLCG